MNWKYRREITITNVNGTLTDYQILVELNSSNFNFSHAQENGSDIRFVASDDETLLSHWIEVWNATNQSAKIWVNVSEVTEGTKIFMYYGNENASDASDVNATFIRVIDGVVGAWHFDEGSGTIAHDTSGEGNDGTLYDANTANDDGNTPPQWIDGKFGKALEFDGVDDYVDCGNSSSLQLNGAWSVSAWFLVRSLSHNSGIIEKNWPSRAEKRFAMWVEKTDKFLAFDVVRSDGIRVNTRTSNNLISFDTWYHAVAVYNGTDIKLYVNGNLEAISSPGEIGKLDVGNLVIGYAHPEEVLNGTVDYVHIYNKSLSAEEISDLYNNYGYTTPNYPNKVLVRKYTEPEPVAIVGEEVEGIFTAIANFLTIEKEIGANYILWKWSCTNPDALVDVFVDGVEVLSAVSAVSGEYLLTDVNENELHIIKIANSFNTSDYVRDEARTLPPFSFFLALLLTTFVLLVITFATTSTVRVIA
ncbi:MAG: hypothetical protein DRN68_06310, partial [Thaumarchaeota archaeon]